MNGIQTTIQTLWKNVVVTTVLLIWGCSIISATTNEEGTRTLDSGMVFTIKISGPFVLTYTIVSLDGDFDVFLFNDNQYNHWLAGNDTNYIGNGTATQLNVTIAYVDDFKESHGGTHWLVIYNEPNSEPVDLIYEINIGDYNDDDYKLIFEVGIGLMSAISKYQIIQYYVPPQLLLLA